MKTLRIINDAPLTVGVCGSCMGAHGIGVDDLMAGSHRSNLDALTPCTAWADKVLVF